VTIFGDTIHLVLDNPEEDLAIVERQLDEHNIKILSKRSLPFSLEDSFISIVQRNKGDTNGVEAA
jgi:ABC-2 type transport system ATP-binding protein